MIKYEWVGFRPKANIHSLEKKSIELKDNKGQSISIASKKRLILKIYNE